MSYRETEHLRILIANEHKDRLAVVAPIVLAQGHEVVAREMNLETSVVTARERPDVRHRELPVLALIAQPNLLTSMSGRSSDEPRTEKTPATPAGSPSRRTFKD